MDKKNIDIEIGQKVLIARQANRLTLSELETETGICAKHLQRYEAGLMRMPSHDLTKVCQALKIEITSLFTKPFPSTPNSDVIRLLKEKVIEKLMICSDPAILKRIDLILSNE